jgi:hypothetical protein
MEDSNTTYIQPALNTPKPKVKPILLRFAGVTALVGGLTVGGLALTHGSPSVAASSTTSTSLTTAVTANSTRSTSTAPFAERGGRGGLDRGFGGRLGSGGVARMGRGLTVSSVSGNTITATGRGGQTVTITVDSNTKYTKAGATIALTDIQKGDKLAVQGSRTAQGAITATSITVVLPTEVGVVTGTGSSTLALTGFNGATHTVNISGSTRYQKAGQTASSSDVTTGTAVLVEGTTNTDGSINADLVTIQLPRVGGQVTATGTSSYTVSGRNGNTSVTIDTSSSTTYVDPSGATVQPSTITNGTNILAEGTLSADGNTLTALRITVLPAASNHGGHFGGRFTIPGSGDGSTTTTGSSNNSGPSV